ncbi:coiled-coil domain-containing protein 171 isoform X2 [Mixophyes fleayi]|uniref:coiled-coil domain-containing protein 171 isoform X2 n=1 Tax=Mixophyes fleayi TaxID=3061075 RepID=UPI003F4D8B9D
MDKMTFISQNHSAANEVTRSVSLKHAKEKLDFGEITELRYKLNKAKAEHVELVVKHNEELSSCESRFAKLRSEVEKGEAIRQSLEYELAVARKQCNEERMALEEEKKNSFRIQEQYKAQSEELQRKIYSIGEGFHAAQVSWQDAQKAFESDLKAREHTVENCKKEQDMLMSEKHKLEALYQKQNMVIDELQHKLHELDIEKNSHMDTVRRHKSDLGFSLEREERLKQELEAANQRVKNLEENIEAERAAHLESKFNSEIIQLRIRDLEGSLQVEKSSQAQTASDLDLIRNQFKEVENAYNREKNTAQVLTDKLQTLEEECSLMVNDFTAESDKKNKLIVDLSEKLKNSEENFAAVEQDLAVTKKHQFSLEEASGRTMRDLQTLVDSFNVSRRRLSGTYNDKCKPAGPAVLEALRGTLTDYQNTLESTSNELETKEHVCAVMKEELKSSKQMIQSLCTNLENEQVIFEKELHRLSSNCAERESQIARMQSELEKAKDAWEIERRRVLESESENHKITRGFQKDKEEKLTFLHRLYQRLVAGCVLIKQPECMLDNFSWPELCVVLQENVDVLASDLNRANEKVSNLEYACKNKADVMRDLKQNHEVLHKKLAEQMKAQQSSWQKKNKDLEEHYSALLREVHARAQKFQRLAEKSKDQISIFEKTKDQMALENVHIKNVLINNEKDHKSLLAACALMAGAFTPLYSRTCTLAAQRNLLQDRMNTYVDVQNEIRKLVQALSDNEFKKDSDFKRSRNHFRCMKHVFRRGVIVVLAANRLQHLGGSSRSLFTWMEGLRKGPRILVCPGGAQTKQKTSGPHDGQTHCQEALKWLTSADLLSAVISAMSELLAFINQKDTHSGSPEQIIDAARNCFSKLMNKMYVEMETRTADLDRCSIVVYPDSLVHRLARGLHKINSQTSSMGLNSTTSIKKCLAALKKQILAFTQRLHRAEVERRSLRLELSDIKKKNSKLIRSTDNPESLKEQIQQSQQSKVVPYDKFKTTFEELNNALVREQEAQILLNEQSQQMLALNYRIGLHSKEEAEKDQTLSEAVQSLSEAKLELRRKDQSLRQQNRQLTQLEQDKRRLEESIYNAESALRVAAKDKEDLINHMMSVAVLFQKFKDQTSLSWAAAKRLDFTLQLPKLTAKLFEVEGHMGRAEFTACQNMISCFLDIYQFVHSKITALEREITFHQEHIATLKSELQTACLREKKSLSPVKYDVRDLPSSKSEFLFERNVPDFLPLQPELDLTHSHMKYNYTNSRSLKPIDNTSTTDLALTAMQELPNRT